MAPIKLLIHAPTAEALKRAQNNARNLLKLEADAIIEIVVNGPAVSTAVQIDDASILPLLVLCQNSLNSQSLTPPEGVQTVTAAVRHLALQQAQGWAYVRA